MIQIYDKEFSQKRIATLMYVYLSCGGKLNKNTFNNIAYKLYHYMEDLFVEDTMCITEEVKSRIEDFKTIANTLPNPALESGYYPIGIVSYKNFEEYQFEEEYKAYQAGNTYEFPFKFIPMDFPSYTTVNGICELRRKSDGHSVITSCGIPSVYMTVSGIVYGKFSLEFTTTATYPIFKWFNENDEVIYTKKGSAMSSSYKVTDYDYRLKYLYINTTNGSMVEQYKEFDFNIDLSELTADTSLLVDGDVYEGESIQISENISVGNILGKKINGEIKDQKYELLKTRFGTIVSENTGLPLKYLTVLYSSSEAKYYALLSDYPMAYYGYGGVNYGIGFGSLYNGDSSAKIFFEVWESVDDITYTKSYVSVGSAISAGNYKSIYYYGYIKSCDKIHYTNYNMLVSFYNVSYFTLDEGMERRTVKTPHIAHKTDEKPTIGSIGEGSIVEFGHHRYENSPKEAIRFQILDYSDNLNTIGANFTNYAKRPSGTAMLETVSNIDYLVHNVNTSLTSLQDSNTTLFRWLNSDAPEGQWFTPINANDLPPSKENLPSSYQNGAYAHRAGFLNTFSSQERDALIYCELENGYKGKVFIAQRGEEGYALTNVVQPSFYRYGLHRRYKNFTDNFIHHPYSSSVLGTKAPEDMEYQYIWKRTRNSTGSYYIGSSSSWLGYTAAGVSPIIFLPEDLELEEVVNEADPYEVVYKVVLPELETFIDIGEADILKYSTVDKDMIADIKKDIRIEAKDIFDIEKTVKKMIDALEKFDIKREVSVSSIAKYDMFKTLINETISKCDIEASRTVDTNDYYDISRYSSSSIADEYDIRKETLKVIANILDTNREIVLEIIERYDIEKEVIADILVEMYVDIRKIVEREEESLSDIAREVRKQIEELLDVKVEKNIENSMSYDLLSSILATRFSEFDTKRSIRHIVSEYMDILKKTEVNSDVIADIERIIERNISDIADIKREIERKEEALADIERSVLSEIKERFDVSIETLISLSTIYDIDREVVKEVVDLFDTMRKMRGENKMKGIILEKVIQTTDETGIDTYLYQTIKNLKGNMYDVKNSVEPLPALVSDKTKYIFITRDKSIKSDNVINYDGKRYIIEAMTRNRVFWEVYLKEE